MTPTRAPVVRRWAIASLVANVGIVVTGGAVRLTASGLGCPVWPRCTEESFVPTGEMGVHGAIEFGNRLLTFVLVAVAVGTFVAAWRARDASGARRRDLWRLALLLALGIPAQALLGGVVVLTDLDPWLVGWHFLLSMLLIGGSVVLLRRAGSPGAPVHPLLRRLAVAALIATGVVVWLGTVTTATGPHAGDASAPRTGLDLQLVAQAHADAVFLLLGVTIAVVVAAVTLEAPARVRRAAWTLLGIEVVQGVVGYTQWFTGLPPLLVAVHLLGASLAVAAAVDLVVATRRGAPLHAGDEPTATGVDRGRLGILAGQSEPGTAGP